MFQETSIFKSMTVRKNIIVAHHLRAKATLFGFCIGSKQAKRDDAAFGQSADDIIAFLGMDAIAGAMASNLPQGAFARAWHGDWSGHQPHGFAAGRTFCGHEP